MVILSEEEIKRKNELDAKGWNNCTIAELQELMKINDKIINYKYG